MPDTSVEPNPPKAKWKSVPTPDRVCDLSIETLGFPLVMAIVGSHEIGDLTPNYFHSPTRNRRFRYAAKATCVQWRRHEGVRYRAWKLEIIQCLTS